MYILDLQYDVKNIDRVADGMKKNVFLHPQNDGGVAQLVRASDS